jgi:hypothetical protein
LYSAFFILLISFYRRLNICQDFLRNE